MHPAERSEVAGGTADVGKHRDRQAFLDLLAVSCSVSYMRMTSGGRFSRTGVEVVPISRLTERRDMRIR